MSIPKIGDPQKPCLPMKISLVGGRNPFTMKGRGVCAERKELAMKAIATAMAASDWEKPLQGNSGNRSFHGQGQGRFSLSRTMPAPGTETAGGDSARQTASESQQAVNSSAD